MCGTEDDSSKDRRLYSRREVEISEVLAARTITSDVEMILKVNRPDFLGNSMWEFNHEGHPMTASILDIE